MKKRQRCLKSGLIISLASALLLVACSSENYLTGRGSNSASPITSLISRRTAFNLIYSPDGSTFGARSMAQAQIDFDFGMVSSRKAPGTLGQVKGIDYTDPQQGKEQEISNWNNNKVRTLTLAIDAIGIGINLPSPLAAILQGEQPIINFDSLAMIYSLPSTNDDFPTWKKLLVNQKIQEATNEQVNDKPLPLAIEGGVDTSGKSEAFIDKIMTSTWFKEHESTLPVAQIKTHDPSIIPSKYQVADREQEVYSKNNNTIGSVMYYSLGYITKNNQNNQKNHVVLSAIKNGDDFWDPTIANAQSGAYPWVRPINIIYRTDSYEVSVKPKSLVAIILTKEFQDEVEKIGFVRLSDDQIKLQSETHPIIEPDWEVNQDPKLDYGLVL